MPGDQVYEVFLSSSAVAAIAALLVLALVRGFGGATVQHMLRVTEANDYDGSTRVHMQASDRSWAPKEFDVTEAAGEAGEGAGQKRRIVEDLSVESLEMTLSNMGINATLLVSENAVAFRLKRFPTEEVLFRCVIDDFGNIEIQSTPVSTYVQGEEWQDTIRLLQANSRTKLGKVGLERVGDAVYRVWVDHYMDTDGVRPSEDSFSLVLDAFRAVYDELLDTLDETQRSGTHGVVRKSRRRRGAMKKS